MKRIPREREIRQGLGLRWGFSVVQIFHSELILIQGPGQELFILPSTLKGLHKSQIHQMDLENGQIGNPLEKNRS